MSEERQLHLSENIFSMQQLSKMMIRLMSNGTFQKKHVSR